MRILIDATPLFPLKRSMGPTGVGRWTREVTVALGRLQPDWKLSLVIDAMQDPRRDPSWPTNVDFDVVKWPARAYRLLRHFRLLPAIERLVGPADVVLGSNYIPLRASTAVEVPVIYDLSFIHHPETVSRKHLYFLRVVLPGVLRRAPRVITISETIRSEIAAHYSVDIDLIDVLAPGCDLERFAGDPMKSEHIEGLPETYFLYVGTLEPRKNLPGLLEAYRQLKEHHPTVPPLVLAGGVGWRVRELLKTIRARSVEGSIIALGYVPDHLIPALYARAMALVFPSFYEGFGLPALEAMASGCAVIGGDRSGIPEVLGEAGLLVDPYDSAAIASAMQRVHEDPVLRARLVDEGKERARSFTWERTGRLLAESLTRATADRRA